MESAPDHSPRSLPQQQQARASQWAADIKRAMRGCCHGGGRAGWEGWGGLSGQWRVAGAGSPHDLMRAAAAAPAQAWHARTAVSNGCVRCMRGPMCEPGRCCWVPGPRRRRHRADLATTESRPPRACRPPPPSQPWPPPTVLLGAQMEVRSSGRRAALAAARQASSRQAAVAARIVWWAAGSGGVCSWQLILDKSTSLCPDYERRGAPASGLPGQGSRLAAAGRGVTADSATVPGPTPCVTR